MSGKNGFQGYDGFGGRTFLYESELATYWRRKPWRDVKKAGVKKADICEVCLKPGSPKNPLQYAHKIPFTYGVFELGLTPEFLDGAHNIVTAHRTKCNNQVQLDLEGILRLLREGGVTELPSFLAEKIHQLWRDIGQLQ